MGTPVINIYEASVHSANDPRVLSVGGDKI